MFKTLTGRLAAALFGILLLAGALHAALTFLTTRLHFQEVTQRLNRDLAGHLVHEKILLRGGRVDQGALKEVFHMLMVINPSIEIYLLDPEGRILAFSAPPGRVKRERVGLGPVAQFLRSGDDFPLLGDDPRDAARRKVFSAARIPREGALEGYLYVVLGSEEFDTIAGRLRGSHVLRLSAVLAATGLAVSLGAGLAAFAFLTRRLRRLAAAMDAFRRGGFRELPEPAGGTGGGDEIGELSRTFRQMAERMRDQLRLLAGNDALRRELVANVSHDLRTPLSSLQGYLESLLLREASLPPGERRQQLEAAHRQCLQLGRLVAELFELARLDSRERQPRVEPFAPGELVQDVVQKLRMAAERQQVRLDAELPRDLPLVQADIGLIERVLENLIENALKHTPAGGSVRVALRRENGNVLVRVADTGCGIAREEIPHIFERFYRASRSGPRGEGAGLGLAIAKKIVELHGGTIQVESAPAAGATFAFPLPVHPAPSRAARRA